MPGLLESEELTDDQRRANDKHRPLVVVAVLAVLFIYLYLFTHVADPLGLPRPQELANELGMTIDHVFDSDRNVDSNIGISMTQRFERNDDERLVFLLIVGAAFLCAYFLPLRYKQGSLVGWSILAILMLYGVEATAGLLLAHFVVFLLFHPRPRGHPGISAVAGAAGYVAFGPDAESMSVELGLLGGSAVISVALYRFVVLHVLENPRVAQALRAAAVHSAILTICIGVLSEGLGGEEWSLPLGLLMFFWQWARLTMYHIDYKDGLVPKDLSLDRYLAVFLSPGVIPNWNWGVTIPQGYAYVSNNFLAEDKNKLALEGITLLGIALLYLVLWDWVRHSLDDFLADRGIQIFRANTRTMVRHFIRGGDVSTGSVLLTTLLDLLRFMMFFGGVMHFKVGIWRICGYRIAPYYNRPWLATNLMSLWARFAFHYREFMVRAFYYPVFFRFLKQRPALRIFVASMAAATVGNMIWHFTERAFFRGLEIKEIVYVLGTWPYFVLLGLGIAATQLYLMWRKRTRKPWTRDRWMLRDVLAAYLTLQYFGLIHIFARPVRGSTTWDLCRLFLKGFGFELAD